jgi:hypothetical protein
MVMAMSGSARGWVMACLAIVHLAIACGDPVNDALVASLGPEAPGVPPGPLHRPGQPCLACHHDGQPEAGSFSLAGTIYREKGRRDPIGKVEVLVLDARGRRFSAHSNCAGNFYVRPEEFMPATPFWLTLKLGDQSIDMESPVFREGSCATCHAETLGPRSAGLVFMADEPDKVAALPQGPCVEP